MGRLTRIRLHLAIYFLAHASLKVFSLFSELRPAVSGEVICGTRPPRPSSVSGISRQRQYQLRHMRAGLCGYCSRPVLNGTLFCELHRRKRNLKQREWQRERFRRKIRYYEAESYNFRGAKFMSMEAPRFSDPRWEHYRTRSVCSCVSITLLFSS